MLASWLLCQYIAPRPAITSRRGVWWSKNKIMPTTKAKKPAKKLMNCKVIGSITLEFTETGTIVRHKGQIPHSAAIATLESVKLDIVLNWKKH